MKAYQFKQVDKQRDMHLQAWLNATVKATKPINGGKKSEPVYKTFNQFFDYEKRVKEIANPSNKSKKLTQTHRDLAQIAARVNHQ